MSDKMWTQRGASLSQKNACKEYGLTDSEIIEAMKDKKLQYQINYAHGNPYYKLLRDEVEVLAQELHGAEGVKQHKLQERIRKIDSEIRSFKRKIKVLEREKVELEKAPK